MNNRVIPDDIALFIVETIENVAELEGLLILRQDPQTNWDAQSLAARLYISEGQTDELLRTLCAKGLIMIEASQPQQYHYGPASSQLGLMVDRLATIYAKHIVPVTNLIHSKPTPRVQGFADAFRFRKDE